MKTICVKCAWHHNAPSRRTKHRCYAPWKKNVDKVTGKLTPAYRECQHWNNGNCILFKPKWYVRFWSAFLDDIFTRSTE